MTNQCDLGAQERRDGVTRHRPAKMLKTSIVNAGCIQSATRKASPYTKNLRKRNRPKVDIYGEEEEEQADIDKAMKSLHDALGKGGPREEKD